MHVQANTKMNSSKKKTPPPNKPSCFSTIFGKFNCAGNLPTHPCPLDEFLEKKHDPGYALSLVKVQTQSLGIVARLMGLDTLPNQENITKSSSSTNDSLFRSKSLNSLHFLPDFDPIRASFHRRAKTSSNSFHEQGHNSLFLGKIDENLEFNLSRDASRRKNEDNKGNDCRKKVENSGSKKRYGQERYYRGKCTNSSRKSSNKLKNACVRENVVSKNKKLRENCVDKSKSTKFGSSFSSARKVDRLKQDRKYGDEVVQSDALSRSPVSVLDHHQLEFDSPSTGNLTPTQTTSNTSTTNTSSPLQDLSVTSKENDDDNISKKIARKRELAKTNRDAVSEEYFAGLSEKICRLGEDQLSKDLRGYVRRYKLFKANFMEELCKDFGHDMLELLLNDLIIELVFV